MTKTREIFDRVLVGTQKTRVLRQVQSKIARKAKFLITTPNPEMVSLALNNSKYSRVLMSSDIFIPDGVGLSAAKMFLNLPSPKLLLFRFPVLVIQGIYIGLLTIIGGGRLSSGINIIRGREIFEDMIKIANKRKYRVFLYASWVGVAQKAKETLSRSYKKIEIEVFTPPVYNKNGVPIDNEQAKIEKSALRAINDFNPHMLFVGMSPPKQLLFLSRVWNKIDFNMAMTVGQTLDIYAGRYKTIPGTFEKLGLEWLWRLLTGTKSLKRIWISFPVFPLKVFWYKLFSQP